MITYRPLWKTMKEKNISSYKLRKDYEFSAHTISRLRKDGGTSTWMINRLCEILDCRVEDVAEYIPDREVDKK